MGREQNTVSRAWKALIAVVVTAVFSFSLVGCGDGSNGNGRVLKVPESYSSPSEAMKNAKEKDMILIGPGTYQEELVASVPNVTIRGTDRNKVIFDGENKRSQGVLVIADGVRVQNLTTKAYQFNGVLITGLHDGNQGFARGSDGYSKLDKDKYPPLQRYEVDSVTAYNNGLYGIYAFNAQKGVIKNSYTSGSADSGIYLGQCANCDATISNNVAENNAVGFENANASNGVYITGNRFSNNRVGVTLLSNYIEAYSPQADNVVAGNVIADNAQADSPAQADGGWGVGIGVGGGTKNIVEKNLISGNPKVGVQIRNTEDLPAKDNQFLNNNFLANAVDIGDSSNARAVASGNCYTSNSPIKVTPEALSSAQCPTLQAPGTGDAGGAVPDVTPPKGANYRNIAAPPEQPSMQGTMDQLPSDPLPTSMPKPDLAGITTPEASYLKDLTR